MKTQILNIFVAMISVTFLSTGAMVKGHNEVLDVIDNQLLKNADNTALKKHLTDTRAHIAAHLEKAEQLQDTI